MVILPGFGNHHHHDFRQRTAGHQQQFECIVKVPGIGTVRLDDREQLFQVIPEQVTGHHSLPGIHPVRISPQCVNLAVMSHETTGLGAIPTGERVRGEAGVNHGQVTCKIISLQVGIEGHDLIGVNIPL